MGHVVWGSQGVRWYTNVPPTGTGLGDLGLYSTAVHAFSNAMQGVATMGVVAALPYPSLAALSERVATLLLLNLHFTCGVVGDKDLSPIW